jgi:hypothetical protein
VWGEEQADECLHANFVSQDHVLYAVLSEIVGDLIWTLRNGTRAENIGILEGGRR